jgi:hypothetical protein
MRCGRQCGYSLSRRTSRASCLCEVWPERVSVGPARCRRVRNVRALPSERTAPAAFLRGRPCGKRPGPAMAAAGYFPPRARRMGLHFFFIERRRALHREAKYPSSAILRFAPAAARCRSGPPAAFCRHEGRDWCSRSDRKKHFMTTDHDDTGHEPSVASATDYVLTELQLHGYRPFQDEPDPRPLPKRATSLAPSLTSSTRSWRP